MGVCPGGVGRKERGDDVVVVVVVEDEELHEDDEDGDDGGEDSARETDSRWLRSSKFRPSRSTDVSIVVDVVDVAEPVLSRVEDKSRADGVLALGCGDTSGISLAASSFPANS